MDIQELIGFPIDDERARSCFVEDKMIICTCLGVSSYGKIWLRRRGNTWEARQHVIMLLLQETDELSHGLNPFDEKFCANYARGIGLTKEVAIKKLVEDKQHLSKLLV